MAVKLKEADKARIEKLADDTIAKFVGEVPAIVRKHLNDGILALLGMSNRWGHALELDSSNGRESAIAQLIKSTCAEEIKGAVEPIAKEAIAKLRIDTKFINAMGKAATDKFRFQLERQIESMATSYAEHQAKALVIGLDKTDFSNVFSKNLEAEDPESYDTKVGELILQEVARRMANKPKGKTPQVVSRMSEGRRTVVIIEDQ